jgi:hypothetical protein
MATYPGGTYAPASKSNGQVIQPSFFNDPEAEITAIEDALRNGLPHGLTISTGGLTVSTGSVNIGGPSSLVSLSVSGGSTLGTVQAGASTVASLSVAGASTFAARPTMPPPDIVLLTGSTSQFANNSSGGVLWPTQTFAGNSSVHSTGTNPDRVAPQSTGVWAFSVTLTLSTGFAEPSTGTVDAIVKDSSGTVVGFGRFATAGGKAPSANADAYKRFDTIAASPYLRAVCVQRGGSTASLDGTRSFVRFYKL